MSYIEHTPRQQDLHAPVTKTVEWDGAHDPKNPKNLANSKKWFIVAVLASGSTTVTCASSIYTMTYLQMNREFGNSHIMGTLGLTLFVFGLGISPMILGPLSEFYGRRPIYLLFYSLFLIWLIPCALAPNIQTMLIARFMDGISGSAFLSIAGATLGDIFTNGELQAPMTIYSASMFLGPCTGPVIGGFINSNATWRWTYYVLLIWSGTTCLAIVLGVPETYNPVLLRHKAREMRAATGDSSWKSGMEVTERSVYGVLLNSLYRPFLMLFLDPMCFCLCLLSAILLGILYLFFGAFNLVFGTIYGFSLWQIGLSFLGILAGMLAAVATISYWQRLYMKRSQAHMEQTGASEPEPEFRLPPTIIGAWCCVIGLFWFAWTIYPTIHWIVPILGTSFFGMGIILVYVGIFAFLVDAFPLYAASALCANSFARSCFAAAFPLFGVQMYETLNFHWATTVLAIVTLVMAPFPWLLYMHGRWLRGKSRFSAA